MLNYVFILFIFNLDRLVNINQSINQSIKICIAPCVASESEYSTAISTILAIVTDSTIII